MCIFVFYTYLKTKLFIIMKRLIKLGLWLAILTMGLTCHVEAQSTQMTIYLNNGEEKSYNMTENDRVFFEDNETLVVEIMAHTSSERFNLTDIRKITCAETENIVEESHKNVFLSPNPVHNTFMVRNIDGKETIHIYALDGRLMKSVEASENQFVDISDLPIGLYLVKTEHQTHKMIKL